MIDSFEIRPKKTPSRIIIPMMIIKENRNEGNSAVETKKNGIKGTKPPKKGAPPFTRETTLFARLSAFS